MSEFEQIYEKHFNQVYKYAYFMTNNKHDAEDITQEVFIKVAKGYNNFRGESKVSTWIHTIAKRAVIDHLRKKNAAKYLAFWKNHIPEDYEVEDNSAIVEDSVLQKETNKQIHDLVTKLPEKMQAVVYFRFIKGYSIQETAELMQIRINNVSVLQNRSIAKLRQILESTSEFKEVDNHHA